MKILLLGANGQVGWALRRRLAPLGQLVALERGSKDWCGDIANLPALAATVQGLRPDVIVNAAAHTAVDRAESEPDLAHTLNALAPGLLATEAAKINALLVHYSTDYVFDGSGDQPWTEDRQAAPLSVYGKSKREGEQAIQAAGNRHLIFRTSWVYAARGSNFAKTILRLAQEKDSLSVINDQIGAPTGADLLADVSAHAIRHVLQRPNDCGLYHLTASGETSWHAYAEFVLAQAVVLQPTIHLTARQVLAVPTRVFKTAATRPLNSRLSTAKLRSMLAIELPHWQTGVTRMLAEIL
jgi:dTDP-4-dehydrorhamnose reductase